MSMNVRITTEDANTLALTQTGRSRAAAETATDSAKMENLVTVRFQKINQAITHFAFPITIINSIFTPERTDLITGASVGGTFGILIITILLMTLICVYFVHLRRSKGTDKNDAPSRKRQLKHEISLPYIVENKRFSDTLPNTRGPKILVLNATTPDSNEMNKSLAIYNSLFDSEEVTDVNSYSNGETSPA